MDLQYWKRFACSYIGSLIDAGFDYLLGQASSKIHAKIYAQRPSSQFASKRLGKWLSKKLFTPIDSVQSRVSSMPPKGLAGITARRILVFHDADRAGPHVECYVEIEGTAYNIGVKRLTKDRLKTLNLKRNKDGWLTIESTKRLKELWAGEFKLGKSRWLAQSTDHTPEESRMSWSSRNDGVLGYGQGSLRQVLDDIPIAVSNSGSGNSIEFVDPLIDRHRKAFVFKIMDKREGVRPRNILGVGLKENPLPPKVEKLKLKLRTDLDKFKRDVGHDGVFTIKEDGASVKFRIGPKGSMFWSPRVSKVTGAQIMYDSKLRDWTAIKHPTTIEGMGELLFVESSSLVSTKYFSEWFIKLLPTIEKQLSAAEVGGLLNSNEPIPSDITPKLKLYLISKDGRQDTIREPHTQNRERVLKYAGLPRDWEPAAQITSLSQLATFGNSIEGFVGVRVTDSINSGYKFKFRGESIDGLIERIEFFKGPSGKVAGVLHYRDLQSGAKYKTASGMSEQFKTELMQNPDDYIGRVMVLDGFNGGSNRAVVFRHFHSDKGIV